MTSKPPKNPLLVLARENNQLRRENNLLKTQVTQLRKHLKRISTHHASLSVCDNQSDSFSD
jgi:hypothetical protein